MKFTTKNTGLIKKGMTLIEISLVVALLLSLIAILFIGIAAYKRGADRSKCVINLATVHKAARSHQNMFEIAELGGLDHTLLIGTGLYITQLVCPGPGGAANYKFADIATAVGTPYATCDLSVTPTEHKPKDTIGW